MNALSDKKCPICGKLACIEYTPFCSKRCADIDLNRWLSGSYVVHTNEKPDENEAQPSVLAEEENYFS